VTTAKLVYMMVVMAVHVPTMVTMTVHARAICDDSSSVRDEYSSCVVTVTACEVTAAGQHEQCDNNGITDSDR